MHIQPNRRARFYQYRSVGNGFQSNCKTFREAFCVFSFSRKMTWFLEHPKYEIYDNWTGTWEAWPSNLTNIRFSIVTQRDWPKNSAKLAGKRKGTLNMLRFFDSVQSCDFTENQISFIITFTKCLISTPRTICLAFPGFRASEYKSLFTPKQYLVWKSCQWSFLRTIVRHRQWSTVSSWGKK